MPVREPLPAGGDHRHREGHARGGGHDRLRHHPASDGGASVPQSATTSAADVPALARGDSTRRIALGRYAIVETGTLPEEDGRWDLLSVNCGGRLRPFAQGRIDVTLTAERPRVLCRFVNGFVPEPPRPEPEPEPGPEPAPGPSPQPPGPRPPAALPELVLTKRALEPRVRVGGVAEFRISVRNDGAATARQVVVTDAFGRRGQLVSARPSQGRCAQRVPVVCRPGRDPAGRGGDGARARARRGHAGDPQRRGRRLRGAGGQPRRQRGPRADPCASPPRAPG